MSNKHDLQYLKIANFWAENSYATKMKVGALIVKNGAMISDGYNGTPSGFENICEYENGNTKPYVLHAEANAISKLAKSNISSEGSTLYTSVSPCMECAKMIIQCGIIRVVYSRDYRNLDGLKLLKQAGIEITKIGLI